MPFIEEIERFVPLEHKKGGIQLVLGQVIKQVLDVSIKKVL